MFFFFFQWSAMDGPEWRKIVNSAELMTSVNNSANHCRVLIAEQCDFYFILFTFTSEKQMSSCIFHEEELLWRSFVI